jgi:hypothetical protein
MDLLTTRMSIIFHIYSRLKSINHNFSISNNTNLTVCEFSGLELMRLRIHGAAGLFYHATLEVYPINSEGLATALADQSYIE